MILTISLLCNNKIKKRNLNTLNVNRNQTVKKLKYGNIVFQVKSCSSRLLLPIIAANAQVDKRTDNTENRWLKLLE